MLFFPTYRPAKNDRAGMEVDFNDIAFGNHLHTWHLSFGQHLIDKVIPRDIPTTGVDGVQQAHDEGYDEEGPQALSIHLVLLLTTLLLLCSENDGTAGDNLNHSVYVCVCGK